VLGTYIKYKMKNELQVPGEEIGLRQKEGKKGRIIRTSELGIIPKEEWLAIR
jgi:hypothetical protein